MTYEEALKVLELSGNFTGDDIKKNYHNLVKKYHPDVNGENSTEKMQQINEAYKIVTSEKENTSNYQNYSRNQSTDIEKYREEKIRLVSYYSEWSYTKYKDLIGDLEKFIQDVQKISYLTINYIKCAHSEGDIDMLYQHFLEERRREVFQFVYYFFRDNYIDEDKDITIYDMPFDDICKYLLKIKHQFSKSEILKRKLQDEISNYRHIPFYDKVKNVFDYVINYTYNRILNSNFKDEEKYIEEMHSSIKNFIDEYYFCQNEIEKLNALSKDTQILEIIEDFNKVQEEFDKGASVLDIKALIVALEGKIKKYQEAKELEQKNLSIQKQYSLILQKYMTTIKDLKDVKDIEKINLATDIFKKVILYLEYIKKENISSLDWLNEINFLDMSEIDTIEKHMKNEKNTCNIYVLKNGKDCNPSQIVVCKILDTFDNFLNIVGKARFGPEVSLIKTQEFENNYISLDEYLETATYIGGYATPMYTVLYCKNGVEICLKATYLMPDNHTTRLQISAGLDRYKETNYYKPDPEAEIYKDKEFMKQQVIQYVDDLMKELHLTEAISNKHL